MKEVLECKSETAACKKLFHKHFWHFCKLRYVKLTTKSYMAYLIVGL